MLKQRLSSLFVLLPVFSALQSPVSSPVVRKNPPSAINPQIILSTEQSTIYTPVTAAVIPGQYTSITPTQPGQPPVYSWHRPSLPVSRPSSRNLLYTPEDAARYKVVHPFLTPEIEVQVRIIPVGTPIVKQQ